MKALALLALAGALLASLVQLALAAEPSPEAVKAELDRLAGTWVLVEGWLDGKPVSEDDRKGSRITWAGNRIITDSPHLSRRPITATLVVDPTATPRRMDIVYDANPATPALAIYEWRGSDRYRICIDRRGGTRPTEFVSVAGTGQSCHVWQRQP